MREHVHKDKPVSLSGRLCKACQEYNYSLLSVLKSYTHTHTCTRAAGMKDAFGSDVTMCKGLMINAGEMILYRSLLANL